MGIYDKHQITVNSFYFSKMFIKFGTTLLTTRDTINERVTLGEFVYYWGLSAWKVCQIYEDVSHDVFISTVITHIA